MTSGLRKGHRYFWLILFIAVPIMIVFAIKDLNFSNTNTEQSFDTGFTLKNAKADFENEMIKVAFYPTSIELILKNTLKNASSTVYAVDSNDVKTVIGQLTTSGKYQFNVTEMPKNILIYDEIKDRLITKTDF
jgi:hypothetical protein